MTAVMPAFLKNAGKKAGVAGVDAYATQGR
jgi:hypothetical protein